MAASLRQPDRDGRKRDHKNRNKRDENGRDGRARKPIICAFNGSGAPRHRWKLAEHGRFLLLQEKNHLQLQLQNRTKNSLTMSHAARKFLLKRQGRPEADEAASQIAPNWCVGSRQRHQGRT